MEFSNDFLKYAYQYDGPNQQSFDQDFKDIILDQRRKNQLKQEKQELNDSESTTTAPYTRFGMDNYIASDITRNIIFGMLQPESEKQETVASQFVDINARDAQQIAIQSRLQQFYDTEGSWVPEIKLAQEYLMNKKFLSELDINDKEYEQKSKRYLDRIKELEPEVRKYSQNNPYLADVFYGPAVDPIYDLPPYRSGKVSKDRIVSGILNKRNQWKYFEDLSWKQNNNELTPTGNKFVNSAAIDNKIAKLYEKSLEAQKEYDKKDKEIKERQYLLKTKHMLHDPLLGVVPLGIEYDPENIDPTIDQRRNEVEIKLSDPSTLKYGLLHLGSSAGELQTMSAQALTGLTAKWLGKAVVGSSGIGTAVLVAGEAATNLAATNYLRHKETAAEVLTNYTEKIARYAQNGNFDLIKVVNDYKPQLEDMGFDTSNMDEMEILQFGVSYNLPTSDKNYNYIAKDLRKGLTQLEEMNNALALGDYAQYLGLSYGGKLLNEAIGPKSLLKAAGKKLTKNATTKRLLDAAESKLDKAVNTAIKDPVSRNSWKKVRDAGMQMASTVGKNWLFEATEEGQQGLGGTDYQNIALGADVKDDYNIFRGFANASRLALESHLALHGLSSNDLYNTNETLAKEMSIGGFVGALLGSSQNLSTINNLRKQISADAYMQEINAKGFDNADRNMKVAMFTDYISRGKDVSSLKESINDSKNYKHSGVTDEMIEEDLQLLDKVNAVYKNKAINKNLKEIGLVKKEFGKLNKFFKSKEEIDQNINNYQDFIRYVQNAIQIDDRLEEVNQFVDKSQQEVQDALTNIDQKLDVQFNDFINQQYDKYTNSFVSDDQVQEPMSKEQFRNGVINSVMLFSRRKAIQSLLNDLKSRKKSIEKIQEEYDIDLSTSGISSIIEYIQLILPNINKEIEKIDNDVFGGTLNKVYDLVDTEEFEKAVSINTINSGIQEHLSTKRDVYIKGKLPINKRGLIQKKPLWSVLDEQERKQVTEDYSRQYMEEHKTDVQPTQKQLISYYNMKINQEWERVNNLANTEELERKFANQIILEDLREARRQNSVAKSEMQEETGYVNEEESSVIDDNNIKPSEQEPEVKQKNIEKDKDKGKDNSDTSSETNVSNEDISNNKNRNKVEEFEQPSINDSDTSTDNSVESGEQSSEGEVEYDVDINQMMSDSLDESIQNVISTDNSGKDNPSVQESDQFSEFDGVSYQDDVDEFASVSFSEQYDDNANIKFGEQSIPEIINEEESGQPSNVPEEGQEGTRDDKGENNKEPKIETPKSNTSRGKVIVESFDGSELQEIDINFNPNEEIIIVDDQQIQIELNGQIQDLNDIVIDNLQEFDNSEFFGESTDFNAKRQNDKSPYLNEKKNSETNRIKQTAFYSNLSNDIMPITVMGKNVKFDGQRMPGIALAKKLVIPGWLSKQKKYFIVTDSQETRKLEQDAADRMAVHLIIEEEIDGKKYIYNAALYIPDKAKVKMRKWNMSSSEQSSEILKLRRLRNSIISAYIKKYAPDYFTNPQTSLPLIAMDGIKPSEVRQSNGTITTEKDDNNNPIYRPLTDIPSFNISKDPYEMSEQFQNGDVEIGFGRGAFAEQPEEQFAIMHFDNVTMMSTQGTGYSGKIYIAPKIEDTPSQTHSAPIMLAEQTHRIKGGSKNLKLVTDKFGNYILDEKGRKQNISTAELIFNLLVKPRTYVEYEDTSYVDDQRTISEYLLDVLVRNSPNTIALGDSSTSKIASKLSFVMRKTLYAYEKDGERWLMYGSRQPNGDYVVKNVRLLNKNRIPVFTDEQKYQIIRQLSNNLHWNTDKVDMMTEIPDNLVDVAIQHMQNKNTDSITFFNCPELTFTMEDLGLTRDDNGNVIRKKDKAPLLISWMVNHQILKTDVVEEVFSSPFIYVEPPVEQILDQEPSVENNQKTNKVTQKIEKQQQQQKEKQEETTNNTETVNEDGKQRRKKKSLQIVREITDPNEIKQRGFNYQIGFTLVEYSNGTFNMVPTTSKILQQFRGKPSINRGEGQVDIEQAKKWLNEKLGIPSDNVLSTRSTIKMANLNKQAYGVLEVAFDRINKEFKPYITLSKQAGKGIEYHEGFHYVSLLILSEQQRNQIYSDFISRNKQYSNYSKSDLEEVLAEEFRNYMLKMDSKHIGYRVLKFFRSMVDMLNMWFNHRPNYTSNLFKAIRNGKFKDITVSEQAMLEFDKAYQDGVYYYAPGITEEQKNSLPNVVNASTLYNIVEALSSSAIAQLNITNVEDVKNINLDRVFNMIESMYDSGEYSDNPDNEAIVEDVLDNKELFIKQIRNFLQELGIRAIESEEDKEATDNYENIWDRASYEISKKQNVAFNAKLFFYSIPQSKMSIDENGNQYVELLRDPIFGLTKVQPFDITWNKIMENLWNVENWDDLVNEVNRLSASDSFFKVLYNRIANPDNPLPENTVTELITTIQSAKNSMDTISIDLQEGQLINKAINSRIWNVLDSNTLRKIARYPSIWSQNFLNSAMITINSKNKSIINPQAYKYLNNEISKIQASLNKLMKTKKPDQKEFEQVKTDVINVLNYIGIPLDMPTLNYMLDELSINISEKLHGLNALNQIVQGTSKGQVVQTISGTILPNILALFNAKQLEAKVGKNRTISADRIFTSKQKNSVINLMAIAYGVIHPTPEEFSITGADGNLVYPITQNNYMSDQVRWLNADKFGKRKNLLNNPYSKNSLILDAISNKGKRIKLHTLIAINEQVSNTSRDYFGISPLEDYITKMVLADKSRIILPTMSDKKTWYSIEGVQIPKYSIVNDSIGKSTLNIFYNYFVDEYNAIVNYYNTKHNIEENPSNFISNYHGKIGSDGKMKSGGNGGRFRYFNQLRINGQWISLNKQLELAENSNNDMLMKETLDNFKAMYLDDKESMLKYINDSLMYMIQEEYKQAVDLGVIGINPETGLYVNKHIPTNILNFYKERVQIDTTDIKDDNVIAALIQDAAIKDAIANYSTSYAISIEELEKCFVGDPALYKWKTDKQVGIFQRDVDKIKRLSSVLSTGTNLRTYWGENDPRNNMEFTSAVMQDNNISSRYHSVLQDAFRAAFIRTMLQKEFPGKYTDQQLFDMTANKNKQDKSLELLSEESREFIEKQAKKAANPYALEEGEKRGNINQADAAVYIRPAFYKRIMQSLGEWSDEIEEAYNLLESDSEEVLKDPEKYSKALKASIRPLKMVYFGDTFDNVSGINVQTFDKMALFPMFKVLAKADNKYIYDRMNDPELGEIDMLLFESAVKVGAPSKKIEPYLDNENTKFNKAGFNKPSQYKVKDGVITTNSGDVLTTRIQYLNQLRLQLNTEAHEAHDRSFGTQAVKIGMGNVVDERYYGNNKGLNISGKKIKADIFGCIKALSSKGYERMMKKFFNERGYVDNKKLSRYLIQQAQNTNMSSEIIDALRLDANGNFVAPIASLSTRNWIESKIISLINKEVIDVNTPGGSAIQMASFGFKANDVMNEGDARAFNDGMPLDFDPRKGSMEVMLSTNFFRSVVPKEYQDSYENMRNWLIDNGIIGSKKVEQYKNKKDESIAKLLNTDINTLSLSVRLSNYCEKNNINTLYELLNTDTSDQKLIKEIEEIASSLELKRNMKMPKKVEKVVKAKPYGIGYRIPTQGLSSTFSFVVADVLPSFMGDTIVVPDEFTAMTGSDFDVDKLYIATYSYDPDTHKRYEWDDTKTHYTDQTEGALINKLLDSYTLVISDDKTISETRASIDTLTGILTKEILPNVKSTVLEEAKPFYELMPSFQESRKTEYTSGKAGIAPFALNSTNHCLTQATHLKMKYSNDNVYGLGQLDEINGQDGFKILDWLSAMINAHVDVAKDPYIINLNVNSVTYNMTNLLLRGGKGRLTFFFLAQPIIKDFANSKLINNGVIGSENIFDNQLIKKLKQKYINMLNELNLTEEQKQQLIEINDEDRASLFDEQLLQQSLKKFGSKQIDAQSIRVQLLAIDAYQRLSGDAQILADLVQRSQIDTKKYGNNINQLQNFYNSYYTFRVDMEGKFEEDSLDRYFNDTFLSKKLQFALSLTNNILKKQIVGATNGYKQLSSIILRNIRGGDYNPVRNGKLVIQPYNSTSNKEYIKKINDRIESILRARAVNKAVSALNISDEELVDMLYGKDSISRELNSIKKYIVEHKSDSLLFNIVDNQGNIINDLLNYLQGITTDKRRGGINRILTSTSSMNNSRFTEDRLRSSFYDLITCDDKVISDFAKKLVAYAFVTSYDNRTPNSFYQLVPLPYKKQIGYIDAISDMLSMLNKSQYDFIEEGQTVEEIANSIYLSLVRNYSEDNDIVPVFVPKARINYNQETEFNYKVISNSTDAQRLPIISIFQINGNNKNMFIKMYGSSNNFQLYQRIGYIVNPDGQVVTTLYKVITKLGIGSGNSSIKELYKDGWEQSAFAQNQLTDKTIRQLTTDFESIINSAVSKYGNKHRFISDELYINIDSVENRTFIDNETDSQDSDNSNLVVDFEESDSKVNYEQMIDSDIQITSDDINPGENVIEEFMKQSYEVKVDNLDQLLDSDNNAYGDVSSQGLIEEIASQTYGDVIEDMGIVASIDDAVAEESQNIKELRQLAKAGKARKKHCKK